MKIPKEIQQIINKIEKAGHEAYIVGGCVRDMLIGNSPGDFDIATSADPKKIQEIFPRNFFDNKFGTVTVITNSQEKNLREVQITTYRTEEEYVDKRHPQKVNFAKNIEEDLQRRDFTINAMALRYNKSEQLNKNNLPIEIIDPFGGQKDLKNKIIRAVGNAQERFSEDALRLMRAVRFFASLNFSIERNTRRAIKDNAILLQKISMERIRDEFIKIIMTFRATEGIEELRKLGLLQHFLPEILEGYKVPQNKHHIYDCYTHCLYSLKYATKKNFGFHVRMASLLHDVGKPRTKQGKGEKATFYNHEVVGGKMTKQILKKLKFKKEDIDKIYLLVRYHLFYYNVGEVSESSIRRLLRKVGKQNMEELLQVRMADRIGSGVPKAEPYRLRHMRYIIEKISQDPINTEMLKIDGKEAMNIMNISPGPLVGDVLNILLLKVIENPVINSKEKLKEELQKIKSLHSDKIKEIAKKAREEIDKTETKRDAMTKKKYWVS